LPLEASVPIPSQVPLLEQIKRDLLARGIIPPNPTDNRTPFEIISRLAWALRGQGARLLRKAPAQNGYTIESGPHAGERYSHDAISFPDGWVDCLANAGPPANENRPVWGWTDAVRDPNNASTAEPFDPDAATAAAPAPAPPQATTPAQPVVAESDVARALGQIATLLQEMRAAQEKDHALRQRILETLEQVRRDVESAGKTLGALAGGGQLGNVIDMSKR
jgi:hypothetical protein